MSSITDFEDLIESKKQDYLACLQKTLSLTRKSPDNEEVTDIINELHSKGVAYFNQFTRSIDEYGLKSFELNPDTKNRKIEDALNIIDVILLHWKTLEMLSEKHSLNKIRPSDSAYASIQRFIRHFHPERTEELKQKFMNAELPVSGFEGNSHSGWKIGEKKMTITQLVLGLVFVIATGIIIFTYPIMSGMEYLFIRALLSLGLTLIGTALFEGTVELNWTIKKSLTVKATSWVALFILLNFINPPSAPVP
jgi:hypothetical protein